MMEKKMINLEQVFQFQMMGIFVSISNDGNIILIGAPYATVGNNESQGKAYIFQKNGTIWNQSQILIANDGEISNDGNILLIGAPHATVENNSQQGKAYIYQKNGNEWNQSQILIANDGEENDDFGYSVSLSGNYAIIGAPGIIFLHLFKF
ncbi:hypothetical protein M0811_06424 [Anaeramoeba ignava]|uniref:Uncharacterized protein n=1 Tax=Anaeramoeba ignava TaxID=1746090 RepID=A0A9Q0RF61_ANAIG|nr:hypothetical protein M0811_06424 [Anaeramoeba ignava]